MKAVIGEKELEIKSIGSLVQAVGMLLESFAESLMGSKEELKEEAYKEILAHTPLDADLQTSVKELTDWLDEMDNIGLIGCSEEEIKRKAIEDELTYTDYDSIEEIMEKLEEYERAFEVIKDAVDNVM